MLFRSEGVGLGSYHVSMKKQAVKERSQEELLQAEEAWSEIGESIAMAVVHGNKSKRWAWDLLKPLGIYPYWMLGYWIDKCEHIVPVEKRKRGRPKVINTSAKKSVFKTREEMMEALKLLSEGVDQNEIMARYTDSTDISKER